MATITLVLAEIVGRAASGPGVVPRIPPPRPLPVPAHATRPPTITITKRKLNQESGLRPRFRIPNTTMPSRATPAWAASQPVRLAEGTTNALELAAVELILIVAVTAPVPVMLTAEGILQPGR